MIDQALKEPSNDLQNQPKLDDSANGVQGLCQEFEAEIRSHARLVAGYGHASQEGIEDLEHGLVELMDMLTKANLAANQSSKIEDDLTIRRLHDLTALARTVLQDVRATSATSDRLCKRLIRKIRE